VFALAHDGSRLATVIRRDRKPTTVKVWNVAERKVITEFQCAGWPRALAFTPDDTELLLVGQDLAVDKWVFQQAQLASVLSARSAPAWNEGVALSIDRQRIALLDGGRIHVLDLTTGSEIADFEGFPEGTWSLAFAPDGRLLAAGPSSSATSTDIKLYSIDTNQELRRFVGHVSWVPALTFNADGTQLISAGADQTIRIWNVNDGHEEAVLRGHLSEIYRVTVSCDGNTIVSGCKDGSILVWDAKHMPRQSRFETLPVPVEELVFLPDSREMLSVNSDGGVTLWDSRTLDVRESLETLGREVKHLLVSSDGTRVFATTRQGVVKVLDWPTRQVITTLKKDAGQRGVFEPVALLDHDRVLVVIAEGSTVRLIDTASWQTRKQWSIELAGTSSLKPLNVSAKEDFFVAGGIRGPLYFLNLAKGQSRTIETTQPWGASDVAFSHDGRLLAASSLEGIIRLWDTTSLQVIDVLRGHLIGVNAVEFSPDGQRLASGSQGDEAVKLWDVPTRQEVATLSGEGLVSDGLTFSPDGNLLVGINAQRKALIWRAPSFEEIAAAETRSNGP
jgi:WD40 repeat protein